MPTKTRAKPKPPIRTTYTPELLRYDVGEEVPDVLVVPALLMVEGKQISGNGKEKNYTREYLEQVVVASNALRAGGERIPLLEGKGYDHEYAQGNVVGEIEGEFYLQEITDVLLPHSGMTDLIGSMGLFAPVKIAGRENVTKYKDGRIKKLSIGLDPAGEIFGVKNAIYEVSAVVWGAVRGASLYALTISEQLAEDAQARLEERIYEVWWAFTNVLESVREATPEQLGDRTPAQIREQAVNDLTSALRARLGISTASSDPLPTVPLFNKAMPENETPTTPETPATPATGETYSAEKFAAMQAELETYRAKTEQLERTQTVTTRYNKLKDKATTLRSSGKLTPHAFNELFGKPEEAIALYSKVGNTDLDKVEYALEFAEKYATPVKLGSQLDEVPLNDDDAPPNEETVKAEGDRLAANASKYGRVF